ncbi:LHFPL tetraspan subfamily member 2a protein-like [Ylistrum balloti]|uniref:LHFPL tetraspan subfamily member 2a protein-like n=1 Tax=Ylistrum balloti TaxID=509963 RepID=UPI002905C826|nr:LHFPL tetraspan subfamily member 2a protein-like [Ylistrum balloti]XP_060064586.1 LHFPL tetraspan subfamily member 2a protein-like [Ylistrum balloti]
MISPVLLLWALLSVLVSALSTYSFVQPAWFVTSGQSNSFGMISLCMTRIEVSHTPDYEICEFYGGYFNLGNLPSGAWQAACVLYGAGCILLCCGAFLAVTTSCIPSDVVKTVTVMAGYVQFIGVLVMMSGLLIYPLGLGSKFMKFHCGAGTRMYHSGDCHIGWSFMLAIVGTSLAIFCPVLSHFTDMKARDLI